LLITEIVSEASGIVVVLGLKCRCNFSNRSIEKIIMNGMWQSYLQQQGAVFSDDYHIETFGAPEIEHHLVKHGPVMSGLLHYGLIRIAGEDASQFLQSQLTQDVRLVTNTQAKLSACCDPQGQVLGLGILFLYHDAYYWMVARDTVRPLLTHLKKFIFRSKVELEDFSDLLPSFGYTGAHATQDLLILHNTSLTGSYAQTQLTTPDLDSVLIISVPSANPCYLFIAPLDQLARAWDSMETNGSGVGTADWALGQLVYGLPHLAAPLQGKLMAHQLNLDRLDAINFKKGCYPGQEVIARTQYRGKPTKRMVRLYTPEEMLPAMGSEMTLGYGDGASTNIVIINAGKDLVQGSILLAIVSLKVLEAAEGQFVLESGASVVMEVMGYRLTSHID